jgi:hypothetical protein
LQEQGKKPEFSQPTRLKEIDMPLFSPRTVQTLIDLVENKLSYLDVTDRDDRTEQKLLKQTLVELSAYRQQAPVHAR